MKICSKCGKEKPLTEFNKASRYKDGLRYDCKSCQKEYRKLNYIQNKDFQLIQSLEWKKNNIEAVRMKSSLWKKNNRSRATLNENNRRFVKESSCFLKGDEWNDFYIEELYEISHIRNLTTNIKWEVDHIVPLKGENVTGLHVWYNLRNIPASLNRSKKNKLI